MAVFKLSMSKMVGGLPGGEIPGGEDAGGKRRRRRGRIFRGERFAGVIVRKNRDFLRLAAISKSEVICGEVGDVVAVFVVDHDIDQHEVCGGAHCRRLYR